MTWVVLGHSLFAPIDKGVISNALNVFNSWPQTFGIMIILNGTVW